MRARRFPWWTLMGVVLVVALVVGTGVLHSSPPTPAQRAAAIDSVIRCPSCEDLSVATSSAPTAATVRTTVRQLVDAGRSDQQIKEYLVARYGSSIVLEPPASGWSLLVWVLPLAGGLVAVAAVTTVLIRRRGALAGPPEADAEDGSLDAEALEVKRRFLERSLADADAEYVAGDLSDQDYLALRRRDMARLATLGTAGRAGQFPTDGGGVGTLVAQADPPASPPARSEQSEGPARRARRWWFLGGALAAFAGALVLSVTLFATDRQPGQSATGSFAQSSQQQLAETLAQAAADENSGDLGQAANLYQSVLKNHPDNEPALAQLGWLEVQTGQQGKSASLISDGRSKLNRAVQLDPGDFAVRLYLGTALLQLDGNAAGAVGEFQQFLQDSPPTVVLRQAAPELRQAYSQAGLAVPSGVPAA